MTLGLVALVSLVGVLAGLIGSLLGLGGGIFLVPFFVIALGLPFQQAAAISLMTVIATSSAVTAGTAGKRLINLRLGMVLEIATTLGGLLGGVTAMALSTRTLTTVFAAVTAAMGLVMARQAGTARIEPLPPGSDVGRIGGRYYDAEHGREIGYRVHRLPVALFFSFIAGNISGLLGIGGGILKTPVLNAWCGVPIRVAAATSSLMIGVTAVSTVPIYYAEGHIVPPVAAAGVLGVLVGSRIGLWWGERAGARNLKRLMALVLFGVSASMIWRLL
jgi:uncharacterized membrane protein YfcA